MKLRPLAPASAPQFSTASALAEAVRAEICGFGEQKQKGRACTRPNQHKPTTMRTKLNRHPTRRRRHALYQPHTVWSLRFCIVKTPWGYRPWGYALDTT